MFHLSASPYRHTAQYDVPQASKIGRWTLRGAVPLAHVHTFVPLLPSSFPSPRRQPIRAKRKLLVRLEGEKEKEKKKKKKKKRRRGHSSSARECMHIVGTHTHTHTHTHFHTQRHTSEMIATKKGRILRVYLEDATEYKSLSIPDDMTALRVRDMLSKKCRLGPDRTRHSVLVMAYGGRGDGKLWGVHAGNE